VKDRLTTILPLWSLCA